MKKLSIIGTLSLIFTLTTTTGCDVETNVKPGGTAVEKMAGQWTVTFKQSTDEYNSLLHGTNNPKLDELNVATATEQEITDLVHRLENLAWSDVYNTGKVLVITSNTAANQSNEMWLIDKDFHETQAKVSINYGARTFKYHSTTPNTGGIMTVVGGKILENAATTPRGMKADSIVAYIRYANEANGYTYMKMSGYRYTGFAEDK